MITRWLLLGWTALGWIALGGCQSLDRARSDLEESAERIEGLWRHSTTEGAPAFYSYDNAAGRTVFVSDRSLVPPGLEAEPVDVSHVDLNEDLGNELEEAAIAEHERLAETLFCEETRAKADGSTVADHILKEETHWLGIGGTILLLLLTAPYFARRVGVPRWTRLLALVVPLLLFLGVLVQVLVSARSSLQDLNETSELCDPETIRDADTPGARMSIVQRLRTQLERAHEARAAQIDAAFQEATFREAR